MPDAFPSPGVVGRLVADHFGGVYRGAHRGAVWLMSLYAILAQSTGSPIAGLTGASPQDACGAVATYYTSNGVYSTTWSAVADKDTCHVISSGNAMVFRFVVAEQQADSSWLDMGSLFGSGLALDLAGGAALSAALLGVWALAWVFRVFIRMIRSSDVETSGGE